jgi:hypothetical protein
MAGLDSIKKYQEGSSVNSEPEEKKEPPAPLSAKAVKATGPYALPTPTSVTGVDPALLENMQKIIEEREARKNSFGQAMRDATAWWSGGMAGPGEALARRDKERQEFEATTFGMKRDLAQNRIAQQQAENNQRMLFGAPAAPTTSAGSGQTGEQMAGVAPSNAPGAAAAPAGAPAGAPGTPQGGLLGLVRDPALRESISKQAMRDQNGAFTAIQSYLAKNAEDPQLVKEVRAAVANGWLDPKLVPAVVLSKMAGSGAFVPHRVLTASGTGQSTPLAAAGALNAGAPGPSAAPAPRPGTMNVGAPAPAPAMAQPPVSAPTLAPALAPAAPVNRPPAATAPAATAPAATAPAATAPAAKPSALPHTQPLPQITAPEAAPLVSPNLKTGFGPVTEEDLEIKKEAAKARIGLNVEQQKPIEKAAGESAVALTSAAGKAKDNIMQYDMAEAILRKYPKAFGISQDGSVTAMLSQLIGPGVTVPIVGTLKAPGLEEARAQKLGPKALAARATFDSLASRFATDYANQNLTGEGRGTLSNADLRMAAVAKGLDKASPAASNLVFAIMNRENEQMLLERGNAWKKYQQDMRRAGQPADFNLFRDESPEYKKAMDAKEERIKKRFPEFFTPEADKAYELISPSSGGTKQPSPADFMNKRPN